MDVAQAVIVGVVQGLTEFLPVSSSAHIVYAEQILGIHEGGIGLAVVVHVGTLLAVFAAMWYRIAPILGGTCAGVADLARGRSPWQRAEFRWAAYVCIATVPAGALGVLFEDTLKAAFGSPTQTSWLLMVTGVILFATRFATSGAKDIGWFGSVVVGCAQACAILPGISRSGSTIAAGLFCGVDRQKAAEFSFLLSIPVILGGAGIHILEMVNEGGLAAVFNLPLISAFVTSAIFGYLAIRVLLSFVQTGRLHWFAYYCWGVGIAGTLYFA